MWENGNVPEWTDFYYIVAMCASLYMISWLYEATFFFSTKAGIESKCILVEAIYKKVMRLGAGSPFTSGYLVNLASNDTQKFEYFAEFVHFIVIAPLELIGCIVFFIKTLGWQGSIIATSTTILLLLIQLYLSKKTGASREDSLVHNDEVAKIFSDMLFGINTLKYYSMERVFQEKLNSERQMRVRKLRRSFAYKGTNEAVFYVFPFIVSAVTVSYISFAGDELKISVIFSAISILIYVCLSISLFAPLAVQYFYEAYVASKRLIEFLDSPEMQLSDNYGNSFMDDEYAVEFQKASFSYSGVMDETMQEPQSFHSSSTTLMKSSSTFARPLALTSLNFGLKKNSFTIIAGQVGAGKTSFLNAIMKELFLTHGSFQVSGKVSYSPQEPWIFGGTIRENVVCWRELDQEFYEKVIQVSGLARDIQEFPRGDQTYIYDGGSNLSGGQRARLCLARCLYDQEAELYLLDDVLSALDNIVASQVFSAMKTFLEGKTVIMATHQLHFMESADQIIILEKGRVSFLGSYSEMSLLRDNEILKSCASAKAEAASEDEEIEFKIEKMESEKEEAELSSIQGSPSFKNYKIFIKNMGNKATIFFVFLVGISAQVAMTTSDRWLALWSADSLENQSNLHYPLLYIVFVFLSVVLSISRAIFFYFLAMSSCQKIFSKMISGLLYSPLLFFQRNSAGRILNRVAKDQALADEMLTWVTFDTFQTAVLIVAAVGIAGYANPYSLIFLVVIGPLSWYFKKKYSKTAREIKRLESLSRSPLYNTLSTSVQGLVVIRSMRSQSIFDERYIQLTSTYLKASLAFLACTKWLSCRVNLLTDSFFAVTAILCFVFRHHVSDQEVALALMYVMQLSGLTQWCLRQMAEIENQMISLERLIEYSELPTESSFNTKFQIPQQWPSKGLIQISNMNLQYPNTDSPVLKNITLTVSPGEKVAIVGRTGAGKSSLTSALFRMVECHPRGCILIDGIDITLMGTMDLRRRICMIPQEAYLYQDTLRFNLDPFSVHSDDEIWDVLKQVELESINLPAKLDTVISNEGSSFSAGEKQLLCLARAILKRSKVLVMDEATANIDPRTTFKIQSVISKAFEGCTVITIAHRISTIIEYDRIVLLENGILIENDSPWNLLQNQEGHFYKLVQEAGPSSQDLIQRAYAHHQQTACKHTA